MGNKVLFLTLLLEF